MVYTQEEMDQERERALYAEVSANYWRERASLLEAFLKAVRRNLRHDLKSSGELAQLIDQGFEELK